MGATSQDWAHNVVERTIAMLSPQADPERAAGAFAYMKGIAPFIGISAPQRRDSLRDAWWGLRAPSSTELGDAAVQLMQLREREYHYAAYDLIARNIECADEHFLAQYGERLITTTPWWDSVDGLVSAAVNPLTKKYDCDALIDAWSESGNIWLIRAAITHQRGWKKDTDTARVLRLCDRHWENREFFVAKAIGWAMRDLARLDPAAVRHFLADHSATNRVAIREAERGLRSR